MSNLGLILGWKYDHPQGLRTKSGQITQWPESLGPQPTEAELDTIRSEYEARDVKMEQVDGMLSNKLNKVIIDKLLDQENRLRALEGQGPMTLYNLKQQLKAGL